MTITPLRLWTVDEYHQMIEAGILTTEDKVELLEGEIIQVNPQRSPHAATIQYASDNIRKLLAGKVIIRVQLPITLRPNSEPEPDIAVVRIDSRSYFDNHPIPDDIFLLIEVADTTLTTDRKRKSVIYAQAEISEYWVLDIQNRQVYAFRELREGCYQEETILSEETTLSPITFPDVSVSLRQLFPPI